MERLTLSLDDGANEPVACPKAKGAPKAKAKAKAKDGNGANEEASLLTRAQEQDRRREAIIRKHRRQRAGEVVEEAPLPEPPPAP